MSTPIIVTAGTAILAAVALSWDTMTCSGGP